MKKDYLKTNILEVKNLVTDYLDTLTGVMDDFVESHMLEAEWYKINIDNDTVGFFTLFKELDGLKITSFFLKQDYYLYAQDTFKDILTEFKIKTAYVLTCDELFLSLCLDNHKKILMQAYMFNGNFNKDKKELKYPRCCFVKVSADEMESVRSLTGDFFDEFIIEDFNEKYYLYCLKENNIPLGYGVIVPNKIQKEYWACGMITLDEHRNKGVGRSIQVHLGDICRENNAVPISGCWYYNHLSKKTIESSGRYTKTRLLNVLF